jgi:hypothetical protein
MSNASVGQGVAMRKRVMGALFRTSLRAQSLGPGSCAEERGCAVNYSL